MKLGRQNSAYNACGHRPLESASASGRFLIPTLKRLHLPHTADVTTINKCFSRKAVAMGQLVRSRIWQWPRRSAQNSFNNHATMGQAVPLWDWPQGFARALLCRRKICTCGADHYVGRWEAHGGWQRRAKRRQAGQQKVSTGCKSVENTSQISKLQSHRALLGMLEAKAGGLGPERCRAEIPMHGKDGAQGERSFFF